MSARSFYACFREGRQDERQFRRVFGFSCLIFGFLLARVCLWRCSTRGEGRFRFWSFLWHLAMTMAAVLRLLSRFCVDEFTLWVCREWHRVIQIYSKRTIKRCSKKRVWVSVLRYRRTRWTQAPTISRMSISSPSISFTRQFSISPRVEVPPPPATSAKVHFPIFRALERTENEPNSLEKASDTFQTYAFAVGYIVASVLANKCIRNMCSWCFRRVFRLYADLRLLCHYKTLSGPCGCRIKTN